MFAVNVPVVCPAVIVRVEVPGGVTEKPLSTREVAEKAGIKWHTAEKYLQMLWKLGIKGKVKLIADKGNIKLWSLEPLGLTKIPEEE